MFVIVTLPDGFKIKDEETGVVYGKKPWGPKRGGDPYKSWSAVLKRKTELELEYNRMKYRKVPNGPLGQRRSSNIVPDELFEFE